MVSLSLRAVGACLLGLPLLTAAEFHIVEKLRAIPETWEKDGAPEPDTILKLRLAMQHDKAGAFEQHVLDISSPGHQKYGRHMTRDEVSAFLKPRSEDTDAVSAWLREGGMENIKVDADWFSFSGPVSKAEKLLNAEFLYYHNTVTKHKVLRTLEYSVPESVAKYVHMIQPTTKFSEPRAQRSTVFAVHDIQVSAQAEEDCDHVITPACLRKLYKIGDAVAKPDKRNKLAISGYLDQYGRFKDWEQWKKLHAPELHGTTFDVKSINGGKNPQDSDADSIEASLDIDYAIGISNASTVYLTTGGRGELVPDLDQPNKTANQNEPYLEELHYLLSLSDKDLPAVLTTSYGENEQSVPKKYTDSACNLFARLGARGVSVIFSSGDTGVTSACQTNDGKKKTRFLPIFPAACPFVTSVGGTVKTDPEEAIYFSSGGFSDRYSRPRYQKKAVKNYLTKQLEKGRWKGLYNPDGRGFPDVAAQGANFSVIDHGQVRHVSGTSASAPLFASIIAILNSIRLEHNKPVLGFLNPFLYSHADGFNDITHGGSTGCTGKDMYSGLPTPIVPFASWNATEGWDPVTGLGTPNFEKLSKLVLKY